MLLLAAKIILLLLFWRVSKLVRANNSSEERADTPRGFFEVFDSVYDKFVRCESINLTIRVEPIYKNYSMKVTFKVTESRFNDCYDFYNITLRKFKARDGAAMIVKYDTELGASHSFKNVECGLYNISIECCSSYWLCSGRLIDYPYLVDMPGLKCQELEDSARLLREQREKRVIGILIVSVILILVIGAMSFYFCSSADQNCKLKDFIFKKKNGTMISPENVVVSTPENKELPRRNEINILHCYNEPNNARVHWLKDFLLKADYYESVTTIEYSLPKILFNVEGWLNKMLKTSKVDGGVRKIILVASVNDAQTRDHEIENLLFSKFLDKINDDSEKCLKGYDHLFVVQFEKQLESHPEEFRNVVRRVRYTLSDELLKDHLIDLCLSLCSESEQNYPLMERNLNKLFSSHPIRCLEDPSLDV